MSRTYEALKKAEAEKTRKAQHEAGASFSQGGPAQDEHKDNTQDGCFTKATKMEEALTESLMRDEQAALHRDPAQESSSSAEIEPITPEFSYFPPTVEEQYQRLYSSLLVRSQLHKPIQTIMVVGAHHGDGVTTSASLFARALAKSRTVLLVDANLRTPALAEIFHKPTNRGFADFLARKVTLEGAISPTDIPSLFLMTSGVAPLAPPYLFETGNFDQLLADLRGKFDCIIFDAAPLAMHLDSIFLASRVDGVLLVIKAESTQVTVGLEIKKLLDEAGAQVLGAVVNLPQDYAPSFFRRFLA